MSRDPVALSAERCAASDARRAAQGFAAHAELNSGRVGGERPVPADLRPSATLRVADPSATSVSASRAAAGCTGQALVLGRAEVALTCPADSDRSRISSPHHYGWLTVPWPILLSVPAFEQHLIAGVRQQPAESHRGSPDPRPPGEEYPYGPRPRGPSRGIPEFPSDDAVITRSASPADPLAQICPTGVRRTASDDLPAGALREGFVSYLLCGPIRS